MKNSLEGGSVKSKEQGPQRVETISLIGGRSEQQDACGIKRIRTYGRDLLGVAVADGHGKQGDVMAQSAVSHILQAAERTKALDADALKKIFLDAHAELVNLENEDPSNGATATAVFLEKNVAHIGWVGNSQARTFSTDGTLHTLTLPHEYGVHPDETKRLDENHIRIRPFKLSTEGGYGMAPQPTPKRGYIQTVGGLIEVSRALGDEHMDPVVLHEPETKDVVFSPDERFLVIATDGLWKKLERKAMRHKIEKLFAKAGNARTAQFLVEGQLRKWKLDDNTTIVIIDLSPPPLTEH